MRSNSLQRPFNSIVDHPNEIKIFRCFAVAGILSILQQIIIAGMLQAMIYSRISFNSIVDHLSRRRGSTPPSLMRCLSILQQIICIEIYDCGCLLSILSILQQIIRERLVAYGLSVVGSFLFQFYSRSSGEDRGGMEIREAKLSILQQIISGGKDSVVAATLAYAFNSIVDHLIHDAGLTIPTSLSPFQFYSRSSHHLSSFYSTTLSFQFYSRSSCKGIRTEHRGSGSFQFYSRSSDPRPPRGAGHQQSFNSIVDHPPRSSGYQAPEVVFQFYSRSSVEAPIHSPLTI